MVTGIEHIAIASPDPLKLARWYVDHLDFAINYQPANSRAVFVRAPDRSMLEIIEAAAPASAAPGMRDPGLRHLAITVNDFDAACDRLRAAGVSFLTAPETVAGNSLAFFTDCDGNILHLLQRETALP
jgi:catechol 2,3-dioxygenase-like lactoylglutathione lyase family enzyme